MLPESTMRALLLSDIHLRDVTSAKAQVLCRFLLEVGTQCDAIYILGDLFDVWPQTNAHLLYTFRPLIHVFRRLREAKVRIVLFEGNHDFQFGDFFRKTLDIEVITDSLCEEWQERSVYLTHGDLANDRDYGYRALRGLLRSRPLQSLLRVLPSNFVYELGGRFSRLSRRLQKKRNPASLVARDEAVRQRYRRHAMKLFAQGYHLVIMGHTHIVDDFTAKVGPRQCRYLNTGDWVRNFSYWMYDQGHFTCHTHQIIEEA